MANLDRLIEQVAFGSDRPRLASCLGLYLSPETIYISETHKERSGKIVVDHLVRVPVPGDGKSSAAGTATMNTDFLTDPKKVADLIRQSMAQIRWNSKSVRVTLSHHLGLLRFFAMPAMERRFLRSAIPLEAKKYIPIAFDALANDWQTTPMPPDAGGRPRQGVLIAVTQKKNVVNVEGLLQSLGLNLVGLEVAPCSVLRLWEAVGVPASEPYAQVHFDGGAVRMLICDRGLPVFFREVFLGEDAGISDLRKIDLTGCLGFVSKQLNLPRVAKVRVSGSNAAIPQFIEAFAQEAVAPAEAQDTAKALMIKGGDWGGLAAIGASAKDLADSPLTLDLAATDRVTDEERTVARDILIIGALLAGFFALSGLYSRMSYGMRARELARYQVEPEVRAALQGRTPPDIQNQLGEMQTQLEQLRNITRSDRPKLSDLLREIVTLMPQSVWLTGIQLANPLGVTSDKAVLEIVLRARARGQSSSEEQDLAFQLQEAVRRSESLGKAFEVNMALQGRVDGPGSGEGSPGMDPAALTRKMEERTGFTLTLRAKQR